MWVTTPTTILSLKCWATGPSGTTLKKEAIEWGWELIVELWGVPAERLYATVYSPSEDDPSSFDQEAYDLWAALFIKKV